MEKRKFLKKNFSFVFIIIKFKKGISNFFLMKNLIFKIKC